MDGKDNIKCVPYSHHFPYDLTRPQIRDLIAASRPLNLGTYMGTPKTIQNLLGLCRYTKTPRSNFDHTGEL